MKQVEQPKTKTKQHF